MFVITSNPILITLIRALLTIIMIYLIRKGKIAARRTSSTFNALI